MSKLDGATLTARSIEDDNVKERWKYYLKEEAIAMPAPNEDGETPAIAANVRFHGLLDGDTYHVYITEDSEEEAKMMARAKVIWARADKGVEMSGNAADHMGCYTWDGKFMPDDLTLFFSRVRDQSKLNFEGRKLEKALACETRPRLARCFLPLLDLRGNHERVSHRVPLAGSGFPTRSVASRVGSRSAGASTARMTPSRWR